MANTTTQRGAQLVETIALWWSIGALLLSTNTARRLLAPLLEWIPEFLDPVLFGAVLPIGFFFALRFANRRGNGDLKALVRASTIVLTLVGLVYLVSSDRVGRWISLLGTDDSRPTAAMAAGLMIGVFLGMFVGYLRDRLLTQA